MEKEHRGKALENLLIEQVKKDAELEGFGSIYLCTELNEFYEKYGFKYIGEGFYTDGQPSKIYETKLIKSYSI